MKNHAGTLIFQSEFVSEPQTLDRRAKFDIWLAASAKKCSGMEVKMHGFFYGWYMKCQSGTQTLAVIPAVHQTRQGRSCSIQIITEDNVWTATYPAAFFCREKAGIVIGENRFDRDGIRLKLHSPELTAEGSLHYGTLSPLKYDIMGPFALAPFLECRHSVWSMKHSVSGIVRLNEKEYSFRDGWGYWEGDRGRSFPKEYAWTQCCFPGGSLMLSVADIPLAGIRFTGIIGVVLWRGREYRLATYLGARAACIGDGVLRIVQGSMELEARLLEAAKHPLQAPANGDMVRTIHENAKCLAFYRFRKGEHIFFEFETEQAAFEYEILSGAYHDSKR